MCSQFSSVAKKGAPDLLKSYEAGSGFALNIDVITTGILCSGKDIGN